MESANKDTREICPTQAVLDLYPFQRECIERIKGAPWNRWICALGTGLGKSATAIAACQELKYNSILIVTKASVRRQWRDQFNKWWSGHPEVGVIEYGIKRHAGLSKRKAAERDAAYSAPIQIVSYALLQEVRGDSWDCVIIDEMHLLQNAGTQCTRVLRRILDKHVGKAIIGLTATLIPNDVSNLWAPLDCIWPGRYGKTSNPKQIPWKFGNRYSERVEKWNPDTGEYYGGIWQGLNKANYDELAYRLRQVSTQVTKQEVAHLLPPITIDLLRLPASKGFLTLADWRKNNAAVKLPTLVELVCTSEAQGSICVGVYLRETVDAIVQALQDAGCKRTVTKVTGEETPQKRNETIAKAVQEKHVLVCTMHSMGTGIDSLANCSSVFVAELYDRPADVMQFFGRFHRLSTKEPVFIQILAVEGTKDEKIAMHLKEKEENISRLLKTDIAEEKFMEALTRSEEELIKDMAMTFDLESEDNGYV